jgi:hypothetical protein
MSGKGHGPWLHEGIPLGGYGDTVSIVVPRRVAEDLYYALALAMGGGAPYGEPGWAPGRGGKGPRGKQKPPLPKSKS